TTAPGAAAQETPTPSTFSAPAPPAVGDLILGDALAAPGVFGPPSACPTGLNRRDFVGEGSILKVTGKCGARSTGASFAQRFVSWTVPDGEVGFELKAASGSSRAVFYVSLREQPSVGEYTVVLNAARGVAQLRLYPGGGAEPTILAERTDLGKMLNLDDW